MAVAKSCVFIAACLLAACAASASPLISLDDNRALWVDSDASKHVTGDFDISRRTLIDTLADYDCSALSASDCKAVDLCLFVKTEDAKGDTIRTCINADWKCEDLNNRLCESAEFSEPCKFKNDVCKVRPPRCMNRDKQSCKNAVSETGGSLVCRYKERSGDCLKIKVETCEDVPYQSQCNDDSADLFDVKKMGECKWEDGKCADKSTGLACGDFDEENCTKKTPNKGLICNWDGNTCNDATCKEVKRNGQCKKLDKKGLCLFKKDTKKCKDL